MKNHLPNPDIAFVSTQQLRLQRLINLQLQLMAQQLNLVSHTHQAPMRVLAVPAPVPARSVVVPLEDTEVALSVPLNHPVAVTDAVLVDLPEVAKCQFNQVPSNQRLPLEFFELEEADAAPTNVAVEGLAALATAGDGQTGLEVRAKANAFEQPLMDLFRDILGVDELQRNENFFQLGGNSLRAFQLLARISKNFGVKLTLPALLSHASAAGLAALIEASGQGPASTKGLIPAQETTSLVLISEERDAGSLAKALNHSIETVLFQEYDIDLQQKGQWLLNKLKEDGNPFNLQHIYPYEDFNAEAFTYALKTLVGRHESLRTTFAISEGILKHRVHALESLAFDTCISRGRLEEGMDNEGFNLLMDEERLTPFNLDVWPLFRIKILEKGSETIVMFVIHHAIFDDTSLEIINKEIASFYESYINNTPVCLPAPTLQLRHVFEEKKALRQGRLGVEAKRYWLQKVADFKKDHLAGISSHMTRESKEIQWLKEDLTSKKMLSGNTTLVDEDLQILLNTLPVNGADGGFYRLYLDYALIEELEELANRNGNTLFGLILTSFSVLAHLLSGKDHHIIALCATERKKRNADIIGWMVGNLHLALKANEDFSFQQRMEEVQNELLDANKYRNYPFDKVLVDAGLEVAYSEIIPLFINYLEIDKAIFNTNTVHVNGQFCTQYDLNFTLRKYHNAYEMECIYNNQLYSAEVIEDIFSNYIQVLRQIAGNPQVRLSELQEQFQLECV